MKIGILGTRGIPNHYGGFEQFAESLALYLVAKGHDVVVYNSSLHPNQEKVWNGISIVSCKDPEDKLGTAGQFVYDLNCILHSRKAKYDILLQLGYTSSAIWSTLLPKKSIVVTNMDGLEWKRSKYSSMVKRFLKYSEKRAAKNSDSLIADSVGIQEHLKINLGKKSAYIPYGAKIFETPDQSILKTYWLEKEKYVMLIARMEPENNIDMILDGFSRSNCRFNLLVIGNYKKKYGQYLKNKYRNKRIQFLGSIYDQNVLNNLRYFSRLYFHGHSVGGTNPSLLEAMASSAYICAHDNIFNRSVLGDDAIYFQNSEDIKLRLDNFNENSKDMKLNNLKKIKTIFNEEFVNAQYENLFLELIAKEKKGGVV